MRTSSFSFRSVAIVVTTIVAACSASNDASPVGNVTTAITGVTHDTAGFMVSIKITNGDTGTIAYGPYCPGQLEVMANGNWAPIDSAAVCRASATTVDAGKSREFSLSSQPLSSGDHIRFTTNWFWFNGAPTTEQSTSSIAIVP